MNSPADSAGQSAFFSALEAGATAVTATRRLARELVGQFDQNQLSTGRKAWQSADILPWDSWVERVWLAHRKRGESHPVLLSDSQLLVVWCQIVSDDIAQHEADSQPLWNVRGSAQTAIRALQLIRQWRIDPDAVAASPHQDHRSFSRWLNQFEQKCLANNWTDRYALPDLVTGFDLPRGQLQLCGFDRILPQQEALLQRCRDNGWEITTPSPMSNAETTAQTQTFTDEAAHWTGAATWAKTQLESTPDARIGIILPNPAKSRALAENGFRQILCPEHVVNAPVDNADSTALPFHISLGIPLSDYPPVSAAMDFLSVLLQQNLTVELLVKVIRSPWLHGASVERQSRAECERLLRKRLAVKTDCAAMIALVEYISQESGQAFCPLLQQLFANSIAEHAAVTGQQSYTRWATLFEQLLSTAGWPGERSLDSREFQVVEAFRNQLRGLSELDFDGALVNKTAALLALRQRMQQQIFQIENRDAPVQLMGIAESAGLRFDYLWFGSVVAEEWPPATRPNPFLPIVLQRDAGVERASVEASQRFAAIVQQRLLASSENIVIGLHQYDQEVAVEPSALIAAIADKPEPEPSGLDVVGRVHLARPRMLEQRADAGCSLLDPETIRGGTSLMQSAAVCPRGAYARFRLGASEMEQNAPGLDPAERGTLVHQTLELAWNKLGDSRTLHQTDHQTLTDLILDCAQVSSKRYRVASGFSDQFFSRVHQWLLATLLEWFALEKQRTEPFTVLAAEKKAQVRLGGLPLNFKIDRIDRLANGALVLIDYKTGVGNRINAWREQRITEPQLPLYALSQMLLDESIAAVAFGRVRLGECEFLGLAADAALGEPAAKAIKVPAIDQSKNFAETFGDWQTCLHHWRQSLDRVATEFHQGDIRIAPDQDGLCVNCPTPSICRSGSVIGEHDE